MKSFLLPGILCMLAIPELSFSQEYSYTHYDIADGLAGSTLYCITQDKDGFIWTGTEAGVSRFDGTHFRNFTTKDGLPDLEVLQIFGDSKGRVWMAPFRKAVCYYYQGKIHNAQNDSVLGRIHLQRNVESFAEDAHGNILIQERDALHVVNAGGRVEQFDSLGHTPIANCMYVSATAAGNFQAQLGGKIIEFTPSGCLRETDITPPLENPIFVNMNPWLVVWQSSITTYSIRSFSTGKVISRTFDFKKHPHIGYSVVGDSLVYSNESSGSNEYNLHTGLNRRFLPGIRVNRVFRDAFGNLWFTTMGRGLYRLNSNDMKTIHLSPGRDERSSVTAIKKLGRELWVGDDHQLVFRLSLPDMTPKASIPFFNYSATRILYIDTVDGNKILTGSDYGLVEGTRDLRYIYNIHGAVKSVARIDDRRLLLGLVWGAGIFDLRYSRIVDTLWRERTTAVFYKQDTIYIGTLNGLYRFVHGRPPEYLGEKIPFFKRRISSIAESDGTLWIASYDDAGIIGYKDERQVASITAKQGLTSDLCRTLLVHDHSLWAGTDKGLCRISLDKPGYPITQFTSKDGLASDMINTIFVDSSIVYVGTPAGLSFFDEKKMTGGGGCRLFLLSIANSDRDRIGDSAHLVIPFTDKRIRFEFVGISYRSAGDITYRYRMEGLDDKWRETKDNFLEYPDLPAGNYQWQLFAVNKFGVGSRLLTLPIEVTAQFWKRTWFILTAWLSSMGLFWGLVFLWVRRLRLRHQEKERLVREMNELENTALKSQMNPHFIFNCLNSIQQSIFTGDTRAANSYISGLARLIRMTLHNSSRSFVYIEDEIDYLSSYLELEKMRFKEKIDYELIVDQAIDQTAVLIPPMLIQPYVENALHHGLRPKINGKGRVGIRFTKDNHRLIVEVEDNGVGRTTGAPDPAIGSQHPPFDTPNPAIGSQHPPFGAPNPAIGSQHPPFDTPNPAIGSQHPPFDTPNPAIGTPGTAIGPLEHQSKGMSLTEDRIRILNQLYGSHFSISVADLRDETDCPAGTRVSICLPLFPEKSLYD